MARIVGFVGHECEDIAIYLAKILKALGKKVVVADKTEQEVLCEMFGLHAESDKNRKEGEYGGILLTNGGVGQDEADVIFYMFGYRLNHPKLYECEMLIMVADGFPAHASMMRKTGHWECKCYLLLRNLIPMKHTEMYLAVLAGREDNYRIIPYDERDVRARCSLSAYSGCEIRKLSPGMKRVLLAMAGNMLNEYAENKIREQMKKL